MAAAAGRDGPLPNIIKVMQDYLRAILQRVPQMKALILDEETVINARTLFVLKLFSFSILQISTVGIVLSQTEIISQQVYFTQKLAIWDDVNKMTEEDVSIMS